MTAAGVDERGGGPHRRLERLVRPVAGPVVEEEGDPPLPRQLVLADHELVAARGRGPVDPTQVVAHDVLAEREELLARGAQAAALISAGVRVGARGQRYWGHVVHGRVDRELGDAGGPHPGLGEPEGITDHDLQRAHGEQAASLGGQLVGGAGHPLALERGDGQVRAAGAGDAVDEGQHRRPAPAAVADLEHDAARHAGVDARRVQLAGHVDAHAHEGHAEGGQGDQHRDGRAGHEGLLEREQAPGGEQRERSTGGQPAGPGQHELGPGVRDTGTPLSPGRPARSGSAPCGAGRRPHPRSCGPGAAPRASAAGGGRAPGGRGP